MIPAYACHLRATAWVKEVIVTDNTGFCANETLRLIHDSGWLDVFAMSRSRKWTNGKYVRDLARYLPKQCYGRRATYTPDGRRRDFRGFQRVPRVTNSVMSQWFYPKNGVTTGRNTCDAL